MFNFLPILANNASTSSNNTISVTSSSNNSPTSPSDNYYSPANLNALNKINAQKHAPLAILIDHSETKRAGAVTLNFAQLLQAAFIPILVSRSLVQNYIQRRSQYKKYPIYKDDQDIEASVSKERNPVNFDQWQAFNVPNSQFLFFIPNYFLKYYKNDHGIKKAFLDQTEKLPIKAIDSNETETLNILQNMIKTAGKQKFSINNLRTIFATKKSADNQQLPIWDILINGHGNIKSDYIKSRIAGLSPAKMQSILQFFNNELPTGLIYLETCNAGGLNLNLLEFESTINQKKNIMQSLNYIVIVGAITDKPIVFLPERTNKLWSDAAKLQGKGGSLNSLLNNLQTMYRSSGSLHGSSDIPQVWLPNGNGFQTYQINKKVQILGNVKVRVHEDENKSITLSATTQVVLDYVPSVNVPIIVSPTTVLLDEKGFEMRKTKIKGLHSKKTEIEKRQDIWADLPNLSEYLISTKKTETLKNINGDIYPALKHLSETLGGNPDSVLNQGIALLYPEFISMIRGDDTTQHISEIQLQSPKNATAGLTGILHFIRDAFLDIKQQNLKKSFLIDRLTGKNDISPFFEFYRYIHNIHNPHPIEKALKDKINKIIALTKVVISIQKNEASITFIYDQKAWTLDIKTKKPNPTFGFQPTK